jgi:arylsulfatase A-like enzyme
MRHAIAALSLTLVLLPVAVRADVISWLGGNKPHNVVLFVPDGLRAVMVNETTAPAMAALAKAGITFTNTHAMFPTLTMTNASAIATGHYVGDTGEFGNTLHPGFTSANAGASPTPFMENDDVIDEVDNHFGGNYLNEEALLAAAQKAGYATAAVGKIGPVHLQDVEARKNHTIIIDDDTGNGGLPLDPEIAAAIKAAGLPKTAPGRSGTAAGIAQQKYYIEVITKILLPRFKKERKPFFLVFWSRDPDATQHGQTDSVGKLKPGINGASSLAAIKNADDNLATLRAALTEQGLADKTNIVVTADHGFSTISKESKTSPSAKISHGDLPRGMLTPGFVAMDLALALGVPLIDPDAFGQPVAIEKGQVPRKGNGLIGKDKTKPDVIVAANGGADLIYLPQDNAKVLAPKIIAALLEQDYVSGLFVDDALGNIAGTLPLSAVNLKGDARLPVPAIFVSFKSFDTGCGMPLRCTVEVADTGLLQGQGMHGSFSRADTANFQAAIGPDFKVGYKNEAPTSNADIGMTIAALLKLEIKPKGKLLGRVMSETLKDGMDAVSVEHKTRVSDPAHGLATMLRYQAVGETLYFDAAGFKGRTVGLEEK